MDVLEILAVLRDLPFLLPFAYHVFAVFSFQGHKWFANLIVLSWMLSGLPFLVPHVLGGPWVV